MFHPQISQNSKLILDQRYNEQDKGLIFEELYKQAKMVQERFEKKRSEELKKREAEEIKEVRDRPQINKMSIQLIKPSKSLDGLNEAIYGFFEGKK